MEFVCNICGQTNPGPPTPPEREEPTCRGCGSNVRTRALMAALTTELFGVVVPLAGVPRLAGLRGLGISDADHYATVLREKFDYRNTYVDREPRLDLTSIPDADAGQYDFVVCSEVLEHVPAPVEVSFANLYRLLREGGVLALTVPYATDEPARENYPDLAEHGTAVLGDRTVVVQRLADGTLRVDEAPSFHLGITGASLEQRQFSEESLRSHIAAAGFIECRIHGTSLPEAGILHAGHWSLPVTARRGGSAVRRVVLGEAVERYWESRRGHEAMVSSLCRSWWYRVGRRLGFL